MHGSGNLHTMSDRMHSRSSPREGDMRGWTIEQSLELYNVPHWGQGYFGINALWKWHVLHRWKRRRKE